MFQISKAGSGNFIAIKMLGKITAKDYDALVPYLESAIEREGPLCVCCDLTECSGVEIMACWRDLKFGMGHFRDFRRLALVGGRQWMKFLVSLVAALFKAEMKFFEPGRRVLAQPCFQGAGVFLAILSISQAGRRPSS